MLGTSPQLAARPTHILQLVDRAGEVRWWQGWWWCECSEVRACATVVAHGGTPPSCRCPLSLPSASALTSHFCPGSCLHPHSHITFTLAHLPLHLHGPWPHIHSHVLYPHASTPHHTFTLTFTSILMLTLIPGPGPGPDWTHAVLCPLSPFPIEDEDKDNNGGGGESEARWATWQPSGHYPALTLSLAFTSSTSFSLHPPTLLTLHPPLPLSGLQSRPCCQPPNDNNLLI